MTNQEQDPKLELARKLSGDKTITAEQAEDKLKELRTQIGKVLRGGGTGSARPRVQVKHAKTGEMVFRADYIKELAGEGMTRGEIAKQLGVAYQIVFAATKGMSVTPATDRAGQPAPSTEGGIESDENDDLLDDEDDGEDEDEDEDEE